jgi:aminoglycoside phosphotransferase (APT) family kinase protein
VAQGAPAEGYPWTWSVCRWLEGVHPVRGQLAEPDALALDLAAFLTALHDIDPAGGPPAGRGVPLARRNEMTRKALASVEEMVCAGTRPTTCTTMTRLRDDDPPTRPRPAASVLRRVRPVLVRLCADV